MTAIMREERYTPREFARKTGLNEEYVRQCCRGSSRGTKDGPGLPPDWRAIRDDRARRWYIVPAETDSRPQFLRKEHEILADKMAQLWHELCTNERLVWNSDSASVEFSAGTVLKNPTELLLDLGRAFVASKESKSSKRINVQVSLHGNGQWSVELLPPLTEPFLFDLFRYNGRFQTLLMTWHCALGLASEFNGKTYYPFSGDKFVLEQFASLSFCLNCGKPYNRKTARRLYCGDDCRVSFLRWFERIHKQARKPQAESICKRLNLIARRHWKI